MTSFVVAEVPGGYALMAHMTQCIDVLMIPDVPAAPAEDPYLRPEHEVDLSSLTPGELLSIARLFVRASMSYHIQEPAFRPLARQPAA